ncbi:MFS transporter [Paraburkholderia sp.]|uniref:MFS transporter n=1 Tax=Paraburkholderia sp. TaxID=1926495 RepID=UPI000EFAC20A|nr:MFS transporter [Paraburkholderia sp.]
MIAGTEPRTKRTLVFVLLYIGYCISYIDRSAVSLSLVHIGGDFHLNPAQLGVILSAFYLSYSIMQIPGGWLADRFGSKVVVVVSIAFWSLFTALTGLAWSLASLIAIRFIFGLGEGGYPASAVKGVVEAYPRAERPKMSSLLISSNYVGSFIAPLVIAPLILYLGWRHAFVSIGIAGVVFALVYLVFVKAPRLTRDEAAAQALLNSGKGGKGGTKDLLKMPLMWKILTVWFGLSIVNKGLDAWMPAYLLTARHLDLKAVGMLTPLPFITASIATAMGGWVMTRFFDGREKYLMMSCCAITGVFLYLMYTAQTVAGVITYQSIVYFFKSFVFATAFALPTRILPQRLVGTGVGMINFGGQVAGFVAPLVIGLLVSHYDSYDAAFMFLIASTAMATLVSLTINASRIRDVQLANEAEA